MKLSRHLLAAFGGRSFRGLLAAVAVWGLASAASAQTNYVTHVSKEQELGAATTSVQNSGIGQGTSAAGAALAKISGEDTQSQGFQFRDPVISPSGSYRNYHNSVNPAGFGGHEYEGDLGLDADIYDGLIAGALYQHVSRSGDNSTGTTEDMEANGCSIFLAKRFIELINAGLAYNFQAIEHNLDGTAVADLDRNSNGFTAFVGASDKIDAWLWSTNAVFTYANDDYQAQPNLDTGLVSWSNEVSYDVTKYFSVGFAFSYNYFAIQDVFPGVVAADDDYWALGPRFRFYPTEELTINLDLETQEGFKDYDSYLVRLGCNYAF